MDEWIFIVQEAAVTLRAAFLAVIVVAALDVEEQVAWRTLQELEAREVGVGIRFFFCRRVLLVVVLLLVVVVLLPVVLLPLLVLFPLLPPFLFLVNDLKTFGLRRRRG